MLQGYQEDLARRKGIRFFGTFGTSCARPKATAPNPPYLPKRTAERRSAHVSPPSALSLLHASSP